MRFRGQAVWDFGFLMCMAGYLHHPRNEKRPYERMEKDRVWCLLPPSSMSDSLLRTLLGKSWRLWLALSAIALARPGRSFALNPALVAPLPLPLVLNRGKGMVLIHINEVSLVKPKPLQSHSQTISGTLNPNPKP